MRERCRGLALEARRELSDLLGTEPFAANESELLQMVSVRLPQCDSHALWLRLAREHRIEVLAQDWRGEPLLRVSFQGYNDADDLDALLVALRKELH